MPRTIASTKIPVACFAPPLTDGTLLQYKEIIKDYSNKPLDSQGLEIKDALESCLKCVEAWWELPESTRKDVERWNISHQGKNGFFEVTPLEKHHIDQLWDLVPFPKDPNEPNKPCETDRMAWLFDKLPTGTREVTNEVGESQAVVTDYDAFNLRNCAFHLLWHVTELSLDREPLTQDKLPM